VVITRAFKDTCINAAFSVNNTLNKLLTTRRYQEKRKYDKYDIYELICPICNMKYIGQTGINFKNRFQNHFRNFKYRNNKSDFGHHLQENGHSIGPKEDIMDTIHATNKGRLMDNLERFYIFRDTKISNQINDKLTVKPNVIFEVIVYNDHSSGIKSNS